MLTEKQKQEADRLRLTYTEMTVALKTGIAPERYAARKAEMQAERDAWDAKVAEVGAAMLEHTARLRGPRPPEAPDEKKERTR